MNIAMILGGGKILLVRDSFACFVAPFLSLQAGQLHICDMRDYVFGEKFNLDDYINEINPDYVVVLFSGVYKMAASGDRYDFF